MLKNLSLAVCVGALLVGTAYADTAPQETVNITFNGSVISSATCTFKVNEATTTQPGVLDLGAVFAQAGAKGQAKPLVFSLTGCGSAEGWITWKAGTDTSVKDASTNLVKGDEQSAAQTYVALFTSQTPSSATTWEVNVVKTLDNGNSWTASAQLVNDDTGTITAGDVSATVDFVVEYH